MTAVLERMTQAYRSAVPDALHRVTEELANCGVDQPTLLDELSGLLLKVRLEGASEEEEWVLGVMDRFVGWCASASRIDAVLPAGIEPATPGL